MVYFIWINLSWNLEKSKLTNVSSWKHSYCIAHCLCSMSVLVGNSDWMCLYSACIVHFSYSFFHLSFDETVYFPPLSLHTSMAIYSRKKILIPLPFKFLQLHQRYPKRRQACFERHILTMQRCIVFNASLHAHTDKHQTQHNTHRTHNPE